MTLNVNMMTKRNQSRNWNIISKNVAFLGIAMLSCCISLLMSKKTGTTMAFLSSYISFRRSQRISESRFHPFSMRIPSEENEDRTVIHETSVGSNDNYENRFPQESRRKALLRSAALMTAATTMATFNVPVANAIGPDDDVIPDGYTTVKTDSGLKYVDLETGQSTATPKYGQLCVISFTGYMKLPNSSTKQKFASTNGFVIKHGNGKMIAGLDEGIHTMKRGGLRRLIISPKLGYVTSGLGPIPEMPWQRWKLNSLLDDMITQRGGNLIFDVRLETFFDDEADQGYYEDLEISPEERGEIESRLLKGRTGGGSSSVDAVGDDVNVMERSRPKPIV